MVRGCGLSRVIGSNPICSTGPGSNSMVEQPPQGVFPRHSLTHLQIHRAVCCDGSTATPQPRRSVWQTTSMTRKPQATKSPATSQRIPVRNARETRSALRSCEQRNSAKSWAGTTFARAAQDTGFKNCCLRSGRYDGSRKNHFFPRVRIFCGPKNMGYRC